MNYQSYKNLPPLAGICSFDEAMKPGLPVDACVHRLKRFHYAFKRLHDILVARLVSEPIYELKSGFSYHAHLCAEHVTALRQRVGEMREPPLGLEAIPHPQLELFFDEILSSPDTPSLLLGLYAVAIPALRDGLDRHIADANPLADHPSFRVIRFALLEIDDMLQFGNQACDSLVGPADRERHAGWISHLDKALAAAGGLDGSQPETGSPVEPQCSAEPYQYDRLPKRDERFADPYNMAVNAETFLYDPAFAPEPKTLMMFYKRLREIDVPEMMSSIIHETRGKPWGYYRDMTRQLWDEARHAMMGEVGFVNLGIDWPKTVMVNFTWSLALNTQLKPIERHAVLYFIEQGLMPRTGKRFEWEVGLASGNPLSGLFQDYDWADEVLHARIGRDWYLSGFEDPQQAVKYGDDCWSRVLMNWQQWADDRLTGHRNWWPDLYREACRLWRIEPDPKVLEYDTSYREVRADLKPLTGSA